MWEQVRQPAPWERAGEDWQAKAMAQMEAEAAALAADPVLAEKARRAKKICNCKSVDLGTIEDAIRAHGLTTVADVRQRTNASGGCGCLLRSGSRIFSLRWAASVEPAADAGGGGIGRRHGDASPSARRPARSIR